MFPVFLQISHLCLLNVWDIRVSMLFNLLLVSIRILLYFCFLFIVILSNFLIVPVVKENTRVKLALAGPAGAPIALVKEIMDTPPFAADKTIKVLSI